MPFTAAKRQQAAQLPNYPMKKFEPLIDEVVQPGDGVRGIHVRFNYEVRGPASTPSTSPPTWPPTASGSP
nr:hypothetical protein GCM10020093_037740 [Planobispora longispora]